MQPVPGGPRRAPSPLLPHPAHHPFLRIVIAMVVIAALAALVAYLVVRFSNRRAAHPPMMTAPPPAPVMAMAGPADAALDQLRLRYARGEVSRADYLQAAADLGAPVAEPPPPSTSLAT